MTILTILPNFLENDLIAVPRRTYAEFLAWEKEKKSKRTFMPTAAEKKAIARGQKNFALGKTISLNELHHALGSKPR